MATAAGIGTDDRAVWSRVGAGVVALMWAFGFFGIIDFLVAVVPSEFPDFSPFVVPGSAVSGHADGLNLWVDLGKRVLGL